MENLFSYHCPFWTTEDHRLLHFPRNNVPLKDGNVSRGSVMVTTSGRIIGIPEDIEEEIKNDKIELLPYKHLYHLADGTKALKLDQIVVVGKDV